MHETVVKSILSKNNGMNIYRGCEHGCIYCDSRSICYQMNHDFEDIEIKKNAVELLERSLKSKRNKCMIGTGSMSDPYTHSEAILKNTRKCLELIDKYEFGLAIQTKSTMILRDLDLLKSINSKAKCVVQMTLTTANEELCKILEPNVATTSKRIEALKIFRDEGIPTVVWLCPILPFINDTKENLISLMEACIEAKVYGIICFGFGLTLRDGSREYFYKMLDKHFAGLKEEYVKKYGNSYEIASPYSKELMCIFNDMCNKNGIINDNNKIFEYLFKYKNNGFKQLSFDFI